MNEVGELRVGTVLVFRLLALLLLAVPVGPRYGRCTAHAQGGPTEFRPAEKFVLERVTAGEVADLGGRFPDPKDRVLTPAFVQNLLMNQIRGATIDRHGVRIRYARFMEPLDLRNAEIRYETWLDNCQFNAGVDLSFSRFSRDLSFDGSEFNSPVAEANFSKMKVGGTAFFRKAVFAGPANFVLAEISVNFGADGARFTNAKAEANFNSVKVGHSGSFRNVVFDGPANFGHAEITSNFEADGARFTNAKAEANFNSMKVGHSAFFPKAVFAGPVNFVHAEITSDLEAEGARFTNAKAEANFDGMRVGRSAFFRNVVFAGPTNFGHAEITSSFQADAVRFTNAKAEANFNSVKVGHSAFFRKAVFAGPTNFVHAEIRSNFQVNGAQFKYTEADFGEIRVGAIALFRNVSLKGSLSIADADLQDLILEGLGNGVLMLERLDLSRTLIRRELRIHNLRIRDMVVSSLRVLGPATLNRVDIEAMANLQNSRFLTLTLTAINWPNRSDSVRLEGMSYDRISAGDKTDAWRGLVSWVGHSAYSVQPYSELENFFRAQGYPDRADYVYEAMKERERREVYKGPSSLGWWKDAILHLLVNYGRSPQWAFYWSAGVIFVGFWVFRRRQDVEPRKPEYGEMPYSPFWFSVGLFLPFINLDAADIWMARQDSWFRRHYARVHVLLGWILVPIGLAAITGIIK